MVKINTATKYRIVTTISKSGSTYCLQKKVFWWPFWYNPDNIDAYTTGYYDTYSDAYEVYLRKIEVDSVIITPIGEKNG